MLFEHTASAVFFFFGLFCRLEKRKILYGSVKNTQKKSSLQNLSLSFILKTFKKCPNFQPRYSYKT